MPSRNAEPLAHIKDKNTKVYRYPDDISRSRRLPIQSSAATEKTKRPRNLHGLIGMWGMTHVGGLAENEI